MSDKQEKIVLLDLDSGVVGRYHKYGLHILAGSDLEEGNSGGLTIRPATDIHLSNDACETIAAAVAARKLIENDA